MNLLVAILESTYVITAFPGLGYQETHMHNFHFSTIFYGFLILEKKKEEKEKKKKEERKKRKQKRK